MKKYWSLIGMILLILVVGWLGYQALFAYLSEHTYYFSMLSSGQNRGVFISALICALLFPIFYLLITSKVNVKKLIMRFTIGAGIFGLVHSNIKGDPIGLGHVIIIFNTILLVCLGIYLILGFSALGSRIERKWIKFNQIRWQEIFLSFGAGLCSFIIIVQILLGIGVLYGIVSWILFLGLGFMIRYERKQLGNRGKLIGNILDNYKRGIVSGDWNINSKTFWSSNKIGLLAISLPILLSIAYLYMGIQNAFTPYSAAWDANHEYMYIPKILAENAGIYRGNTVASGMPGFWHQFLTFVFSLTGCTNGRFGLSPDNIAISMNNMSASLVLIFGVALIFQIFSLINTKKEKVEADKSELKKGNTNIVETEINNGNGVTIGWYILLLWLTGGMGAFLVIVDNKTDLGVMALSLLALLAGLIFLQNRKTSDKKEILKYIIIAGLFFGFASLAKITAFIDFLLFGLLLVGLWFSSLTSLGIGIIVMGLVRKFNILTSSVMLTSENATWFIIIGGIITALGLIIHLLKSSNRKVFLRSIRDLIILGIGFLIPLIIFKLPRTTISQLKTDHYSVGNSLKAVFLSINSEANKQSSYSNKFLAQNTDEENFETNKISDSETVSTMEQQDEIDNSTLNLRNDISFYQCSTAGNIYSEDELNEGLQVIVGGQGGEDFGRYIGYGWKEFSKINIKKYEATGTGEKRVFNLFKALWPKMTGEDLADNLTEDQALSLIKMGLGNSVNENDIIFESNISYGLLKKIWPTSETCYGFNHDAKVLCNNAEVIDNFKIDDLRAIYENGINNKEGEAGQLLKTAIDAYDKAKSEGKLGFGTSNTAVFHDEIVNLRQYYQSHSISSTEDSINIPYRYLVPLNISFNWSLQNLSSYYTDIGFFWVIIYVFLLIALPYAIIKKDKILTSVALTTLIGWGIRWIVGSSILRYGTVLISWTMITIAIFWDKILQGSDKKTRIASWILIAIVGIFFGLQFIFNFLRIASQGANSVFVRYKGNMGNEQYIDESLKQSEKAKLKRGYGWKDIFNLQFPQYNPIINSLADRGNDDGVIIAGTYIQYFLGNQWNIKSDGMLSSFWKKTSDGDLCKTYRRLKNDNTRYLIIDPNIGTVTMGEGNETLFYRFFGKLNSDKSKIEMDGTITTLVRLYKAGYLKLLSTNNIGSKYAFTVDDNTIRKYFGENLTDEELILTRGKMAVLQYFDDANSIFSSIAGIFLSRIMNDTKGGIEDIANIYGFEIDSNAVSNAAISYINKYMNGESTNGIAKDLTQNERIVLITYTNLYLGYRAKGESGISSTIQSLLLSSVTGGSQIIALELNE